MTRALKIKGKFYTSFTSACDLNGISSPNVYRKMKKHKLSMTKAIESIIDYKNKRLLDHKGNEFKSHEVYRKQHLVGEPLSEPSQDLH